MPIKEFVLTHNFKNVSEMKNDDYLRSDSKGHFAAKWSMGIARKDDSCGVYLYCEPIKNTGIWSIETNFKIRLVTVNRDKLTKIMNHCYNGGNEIGCFGADSLVKWKDIMDKYVVADEMMVQIHVKIIKMTGVEKKQKLRSFDQGIKELSDIVLIVKNQKFYVSKLFLATQSTHFKSLLAGKLKESKLQVLELEGIDRNDFQNFLEVLYGDPAIDDDTVNGILNLAYKYDAETVTRRCEEYLIEKSIKTLKEKLDLSTRYKLENLKNNCLHKIETVDEIKSVMPENLSEMDQSVATALLQKSISLHQ